LNMIKKSANNTKFNIIVFPLLVVILGWSFEWFYYLSIIRYWTTIFVLVGAVFINDMSGYFGGVLLGKHKLAPQISPKKTWEGAIFSVLGTILFVVITMLVFSHVNCYTKDNYDNPCSAFFGQQLPSEYWNFTNSTGWWIVIIVITLIYSIVSINADLLFSLIKRKNNVKDFSTFLKGHGGLLDRIDSLSLSISAFGVITTLIAFICSYFADNNCVFPLFSTEMGSLCVY
jgi:phosphatidate cytidylyltransferase